MFHSEIKIVLASGSPRRKDFLTGLGIDYCVIPAVADEVQPLTDEQPAAYAMRAAHAKAGEVMQLMPQSDGTCLVIGADTIVVLDNEIMGKPKDNAEAMAMLQRLGGRGHSVYTGCCCLFRDESGHIRKETFFEESRVWMYPFPDKALAAYIQTGEPMDKAGAYAIQGLGSFLIEKVEGSWTNIVGLPLGRLVQAMLRSKAIRPKEEPGE